jgi:hypothetical protein
LPNKHAVLLSFISVRPDTGPRSHSDRSPAQIVFAKSMARQYAPNGVEVLMVEGTTLCPNVATRPPYLFKAVAPATATA